MTEPRIYDRQPLVLDLEPGTYYWCACGKASTQPFCSSALRDTDFQPLEFEVEAPARRALCLRKHSSGTPFGDGVHVRV